MDDNKKCPVHGDENVNDCHNYSESIAKELGHPEYTVNPENCNCDVGETGPALANGNFATGPGKGI